MFPRYFSIFNSPLTSVNLLYNDIGDGGAAAVIAAAEQNGKIKTLCGIKPDQTEASFARKAYSDPSLKVADALLLSFDLKFSSPLKRLKINADLDIEALKTTASVDLSRKGLTAEDAIIVAACIQMDG